MTKEDTKPHTPKVLVGIRTGGGTVQTHTAMSLAEMYAYTAMKYVASGALELQLFNSSGSILPNVTDSVVRRAQDIGADYILWVDSDMTFPMWALEELLLAAKSGNAPIVGTCYSQRRRPAKPTARYVDGGYVYLDEAEPDAAGLVDVRYCGLGLCLTHTGIFSMITQPWFPFLFDKKTKTWGGEDVNMMNAAFKVTKIRPKVHVELSKLVGHVGEKIYDHVDAECDRDHEHSRTFMADVPHHRIGRQTKE